MIGADQFCGFGGSSEGAKMAGMQIAWAANHSENAVRIHSLNNPNTKHACEDVFTINYFDDVPFADFLMSSPACQGHSAASQPKRRRYHEELRFTAWATIQAVDAMRPEFVVVENVPHFKSRWDGYNSWLRCFHGLGYETEEHVLNAADFGVPQIRNRLFVVAKLGAKPNLSFEPQERVSIGDILEDTDEGWQEKVCSGDQIRFAAGRERHGHTFLSQQTTGHKGVSLESQIRTITTQDHWKLVEGNRWRRLTIKEMSRAMGFPDSYILPDMTRTELVQGLGNAVVPQVMAAILEQMK
jgi:DNA (cytosine-5)-methyltransferase 1